MKQGMGIGASVVILIVSCAVFGIVHTIADNDCKSRGGHLEWIYGRNIAFMCEGAVR